MRRGGTEPESRARLWAGALVLVVALVGAGSSPMARADSLDDGVPPNPDVAVTPAPSPTETVEPVSPEPVPTATDTPPAPTETAVPLPDPSQIPTAPPAPFASEPPVTAPQTGPPLLAPAPSTATTQTQPAAFGRVYPTNPWVYNARPGTRYLDERETSGGRVTRRHLGIDAQGGVRQPIFAVAAGVITNGTWGTTVNDGHGFGNQVVISHPDGYVTRYAHLADAPLVDRGDRVTAGQLIGYMGGSQRGDLSAVSRHLHFEVTQAGRHIDPLVFLTGADATAGAAPSAGEAASADGGSTEKTLREIRPEDDAPPSSTELVMESGVFSAVAMGGESAQILTSRNGTLTYSDATDGTWTTTDTGVPLEATSMSGADTGGDVAELFAVEGGELFHISKGPGGWTKTWTGHRFSGTVSAVSLPGGQLHAFIAQGGYLYHLVPAQGGLWNVVDTGVEISGDVDAVYIDGGAPEAMTVIGGELNRIIWDGLEWRTQPTGLNSSEALSTVYQGGGWPSAISRESDSLVLTRVADDVWTRFSYDVAAAGTFDAVLLGGDVVVYAIG